jgi:hypothetical protein
MSKVIHKKHSAKSRPVHTDNRAVRHYRGPCSLYHARSGRTFHFSSRHPKTHSERDNRIGGDYLMISRDLSAHTGALIGLNSPY